MSEGLWTWNISYFAGEGMNFSFFFARVFWYYLRDKYGMGWYNGIGGEGHWAMRAENSTFWNYGKSIILFWSNSAMYC